MGEPPVHPNPRRTTRPSFSKPMEQELLKEELSNSLTEQKILVDALEKISKLNSLGKTKEIADLIQPILKYYHVQ